MNYDTWDDYGHKVNMFRLISRLFHDEDFAWPLSVSDMHFASTMCDGIAAHITHVYSTDMRDDV